MPTLTKRQAEIHEYIVDIFGREHRFPTIREMASHFGISSPNGIACHLYALEKKGYLTRRTDEQSHTPWKLAKFAVRLEPKA